MPSLLIKNAVVVTPENIFTGDILTSGNSIIAVAENLSAPARDTRIIDADGLFAFPGGIDPHVHFELPVGNGIVSSDDFYTGTAAALAGGTTTIIDFVTPQPGQSLPDALAERQKLAEKSACDYGLHMSVTEWRPDIEKELAICAEKGATSVKVYMAYKETIGLEEDELFKVMLAAKKLGLVVLVHCEDGDRISETRDRFLAEEKRTPRYHPLSRPASYESDAVMRALHMAEEAGCQLYIVHISTAEGVAALHQARERGVSAHGETCPHYLLLDEEKYDLPPKEAVKYVMSPPLRNKRHQQPLWDALAVGTLQSVGTDHCPFTLQQKLAGIADFTKIPNGVAGVEHRLSLMHTYGVRENKISLPQFIDLVSTRPAKLFGLYPRKGALLPGSDADIVLWDENAEEIISAKSMRQNCDHTVYEGWKISGKTAMVISSGEIRYEHGELYGEPGDGHFLFRGR